MKISTTLARNVVLVTGGIILAAIGSVLLLSPHLLYTANGIPLPGNPGQLSEIRAPAGLLIATGLFMLVATIRQPLQSAALILGALVYLTYAGGRLVGFFLDGLPADTLVQAAVLEALLGGACVVVYRLRVVPGSRQGGAATGIQSGIR